MQCCTIGTISGTDHVRNILTFRRIFHNQPNFSCRKDKTIKGQISPCNKYNSKITNFNCYCMISKILEQFINLLVSFPGTLQAVSIKNIMMDTQNGIHKFLTRNTLY